MEMFELRNWRTGIGKLIDTSAQEKTRIRNNGTGNWSFQGTEEGYREMNSGNSWQ